MNGICIKTLWLYSHSIFLPCLFVFFSSYAAICQSHGCSTATVPPSNPSTTYFLFLSLHLYLSLPLFLPSVRLDLTPSLRLCRGESEWWSFSGPCERSCGFSVPHIRGKALALCMLQEFGLAEHQALTTSSPALAAASAGQTNYLSPICNIHEIIPMPNCLYLYSLTFIRTYVCFYYINFLSVSWHRVS